MLVYCIGMCIDVLPGFYAWRAGAHVDRFEGTQLATLVRTADAAVGWRILWLAVPA